MISKTTELKNTNCLAGMRCPKCGSLKSFIIDASAVFTMFDSGSEEIVNIEWSKASRCSCSECGHSSKMGDFIIEELEE